MPLSQIKPEQYNQLLDQKVAALRERLSTYCDGSEQWSVTPSSPLGYRLRAEFRVWHDGDKLDYVMFRQGQPKDPIPIDNFPIASVAIQSLMGELIQSLRSSTLLRHRLFQVEFLSTLSGDMLVTLVYHRKLDDAWESLARELAKRLNIAIVGRSRRQKIVIPRDFVEESLTVHQQQYTFRQYEQAFTQPNGEVNKAMISWACDAAANLGGDLLELYCGNGNFTLPLAKCFKRVLATEVAKTSISAARHNAEQNNINNITLVRLSAEEVSAALAGSREFRRLQGVSLADYNFSTVFVDPPRAGLDPHTESMVTDYDNIIYVSCNPVTQCENLRHLSKTHAIRRIATFDQFPYTDHLECGILLEMRG